jgi:hypothetical protein
MAEKGYRREIFLGKLNVRSLFVAIKVPPAVANFCHELRFSIVGMLRILYT